MSSITGRTTLVGLFGWPVSHSVSPAMHNAAFAELGLNWCYVPMPVPTEPGERIGEAVGVAPAPAADGELERDQRQEYRRGQHDDLRAGERQTDAFQRMQPRASIGQTASTRPASRPPRTTM